MSLRLEMESTKCRKILIRGGLGLGLIGRVRFRDILISYEILIRGGLGLGLIGRVRVRDILISYEILIRGEGG